jgi:hypothetical protein
MARKRGADLSANRRFSGVSGCKREVISSLRALGFRPCTALQAVMTAIRVPSDWARRFTSNRRALPALDSRSTRRSLLLLLANAADRTCMMVLFCAMREPHTIDRAWADGAENADFVNNRWSIWLVFRLGTAPAPTCFPRAMHKVAGIVCGIGRPRLGTPFELNG